MAAASLAIITTSFAEGPARHRAIALWGAMNGVGGRRAPCSAVP